jgi:hypothetical protein
MDEKIINKYIQVPFFLMKCCLNLHVCEKVRHFAKLLSRNSNEAIMGIARARSKRCRRSSAMEIQGYLDGRISDPSHQRQLDIPQKGDQVTHRKISRYLKCSRKNNASLSDVLLQIMLIHVYTCLKYNVLDVYYYPILDCLGP